MISNRVLWKASVYIAVGGMTCVMIMRSILKDRVRQTEYFRDAFKQLRGNEGAKFLLGEPIKETNFDIGEPSRAGAKQAYFEVGVKGPKARGTMYFWASNEEKWQIDRLELQMKNDDEKRLVIVKPKNNETFEEAA